MKLFDGYKRRDGNDTKVLLDGGGSSEFVTELTWDSTNRKLKIKKNNAAEASDFITFGSNAFNSTSYLPLSGGTITGNIGMGSDSTKFLISSGSSGANSPLRGTKMPATSSSWIGLFARPSKATDEGGILLSEDTCVVYNSHDTGWGFLVVDTDLSQSDWSAASARSFGVNDSHQAWSLGGFVKADSDNTYVLLGGGGHKLLTDLLTSTSLGTNGNNTTISVTVGGTTKTGSVTIPFATNSTYATYTTHLNASNLVGSSSWAWNPFSFSSQYWCWGESFSNSNLGSDTGDIRFYLAGFTSNGNNGPTGLCMNIDGCIASASKIYAKEGFIHGGYNSNSYLLLSNGSVKAISDFATSGHDHNSVYVKKAGDTITGTLTMSSSTHIYFPNDGDYTHFYSGGTSEHFSIGYGRIQGYANIFINADTDGSTSEYILMTAGRGVTDNTSYGLKIGYNTLTWLGNTVWHAGNDGSGSGLDADLLDGTHKADLLTAASLGANGNSTTLSVTVGGTIKTGSVTVPYATTCATPYGFSYSDRSSNDWTGAPGTFITDWHHSSGADIMFKYNGSYLNVITDGYFYLGIDIYGASKRVLDEYDISHTTWGTASVANSVAWSNISGKPSSYTPASHSHNYLAILGNASGSSHAAALKNWFDSNKSSTHRNVLINFYSSAYSNGSQYFGYFLSGYDSNPYGGFYVAHYDTPYYVGISYGNYNQQQILTSSNYSSYCASASHSHSYLPCGNLSQGSWNPRGTNLAVDYSYNGGDLSISETSGLISISIDGCFYLREGGYMCLDTGNYSSYALPLGGGTMTGALTISNNILWVQSASAAGNSSNRMGLTAGMPSGMPYNTSKRGLLLYANAIAICDPYNGNSNNDSCWIRHLETTGNEGAMEIAVGDDGGNEYIYFRGYNTSSNVLWLGYIAPGANMYMTNFYTTSDRTKKKNINQFSEHISKFTLKETDKDAYGVIAQEVPEMFRDGEEGNMTVNYNSVLSYYIGILENKVESLQNEVDLLKQQLNK